MKKHSIPKTAIEARLIQESKYRHKMNFLMAKSLVDGKTTSEILKYAEMIVASERIYWDELKTEE